MSEQTEMRIKMKTLVLAEKPSVGRDIGRVLHCTPQGNGFLEGKDYIVTWGLGHLVTLKDPEGYDKKYKEWKMEELPIMPKKLETEVIRQTAKQFQTVKKLVQRQDVKEIVIATDAGREGELVARWILRSKKPETVPETVGVFRDRQGDPGWVCPSEKQQRVRSLIPGGGVPCGSGLAGRNQRHQSTDL